MRTSSVSGKGIIELRNYAILDRMTVSQINETPSKLCKLIARFNKLTDPSTSYYFQGANQCFCPNEKNSRQHRWLFFFEKIRNGEKICDNSFRDIDFQRLAIAELHAIMWIILNLPYHQGLSFRLNLLETDPKYLVMRTIKLLI